MKALSIHPRNWPKDEFVSAFGKTAERKKKDTSKPGQRSGKGKLGRKLADLNRRQRDRDQTLRVGRSVNEGAFTMPGSMK